jgi:hypothetical protein
VARIHDHVKVITQFVITAKAGIHKKEAPFRIAEICQDCPGVSRPMIQVVLEAMRDEGKLEVIGAGRGAMWGKMWGKR